MAEKSVSEVSRDLRLLYQKGLDALSRENLDYALDLFNQVLLKEPSFHDCRRGLRTAQLRKAAGVGGAGGFFKKAFSSVSSTPLVAKGQMALRNNPGEAMHWAEQILNGDPSNAGAHRIILEAATTLELPRTRAMALEALVKKSPKDKALVIQFSEVLAQIGEEAVAENVLQELARVAPGDPDLAKALKNISAHKTLNEGGYETLSEGQGSYRDILKDKKEAVSLEQEKRVQLNEDVASRLIQEYEVRLQTEPDNLKLVRSLAELYSQKNQFDRALVLYRRIQESEMGANDPALERAVATTLVRSMDYAAGELNPFEEGHADKVSLIQTEKLAFQLEDCRKRVEKFPTDLSIRFEMGVLYFQAGKIGEAIQELQKAQNNPHKRFPAMNYLAQCFARRKMHDLAARTLQNAIKEKIVFDEEKKELIYNLGCVLQDMGKGAEALEQLKQIYEVDIGYRDVAAKVDAFYAEQ